MIVLFDYVIKTSFYLQISMNVSGGFVLKFVTIPLVHSRVAVFKGTHLTMTKSLAQVNSENLYTASSHDRIILRYMNKLSFFITAILNTFLLESPTSLQ